MCWYRWRCGESLALVLFPIFLFSPNSSKHEFFSYLYMFSVSRNNLKIFFLVFYCVTVVSRSDRNLANQEQFRSVSYFAIIKHETVNPNVAIIKVWSKNVSIRVNRSRWIRTSLQIIILSTFLQTFCNLVDIILFCHLTNMASIRGLLTPAYE